MEIALEFYETKSGHRARIGEVLTVPVKGDPTQTERKIVDTLMSTETFPTVEQCGEALSAALAGVCGPQMEVIGELPSTAILPGVGAPVAAQNAAPLTLGKLDELVADLADRWEAPSEELLDYNSTKLDKRKLHLLVALDRKMERPMDRTARAILLELAGEGGTVRGMTEAVGLVARREGIKLTPRDGYALVQREVYKLGLYVAFIVHRSLVPASDQLL